MDFKKITLRTKLTSRGGGIEIDLTSLGYRGHKMSAYQNYLGGGMLGSIGNSSTITNWMNVNELTQIALELSKYFHSLTCDDETRFEILQNRPLSAY